MVTSSYALRRVWDGPHHMRESRDSPSVSSVCLLACLACAYQPMATHPMPMDPALVLSARRCLGGWAAKARLTSPPPPRPKAPPAQQPCPACSKARDLSMAAGTAAWNSAVASPILKSDAPLAVVTGLASLSLSVLTPWPAQRRTRGIHTTQSPTRGPKRLDSPVRLRLRVPEHPYL